MRAVAPVLLRVPNVTVFCHNNWSKNCHGAGHILGWGLGGAWESVEDSQDWHLCVECLICLTMFIYKSQAQVSGLCLSQHASPDVEKMILGNKCDANDKRQVSREQGEKVSALTSMCFDLGFSESKNCMLPWYYSGVPEWNDWTFPICHGNAFLHWDQKLNLC